jgi:hypothetical protein
MPFKSRAQRRKFAELLLKGEISEDTFEEWNRETGGAELPERVKSKSKAKTKSAIKPKSKKKSKAATKSKKKARVKAKTRSRTKKKRISKRTAK